jgi:hypothetical protein
MHKMVLLLNEKQLLESVSKISKGTLATFAGQTDKLASAVFKAKALGLELSQVEKIADSLLDIESSLTAEFEAEVISGKQLNLERARYFALTNEIGKVAEELKNQGITQASFAKSSRIEQEAVAKAMGMSRDEMGAMLIEQQAISKVGVEDAAAAREKFEMLKAQGGEAYAIAELGDETYARQLASQSAQERFNKTASKLKDIFVTLAEPVLAIVSPFADLVTTILPAINFLLTPIFDTFKGISGFLTGNLETLDGWQKTMGVIGGLTLAYIGYQKISAALEFAKIGYLYAQEALIAAGKQGIIGTIGALTVQLGISLGILSASLATNAAVTFGVGVAVAIAAAAAGYAAIKSLTANDMVSEGESGSGYGKRTLFGPEGAIALNNKDTVIAGTNLFPDRGNDRNLQPPGATNVTVTLSKGDIMAIANAVREGASQANINVNLDGNAVSNTLQTPMAMGARRYSV